MRRCLNSHAACRNPSIPVFQVKQTLELGKAYLTPKPVVFGFTEAKVSIALFVQRDLKTCTAEATMLTAPELKSLMAAVP